MISTIELSILFLTFLQEIEDGRYRAVAVNPEILMKNRGVFEKMWKKPTFTARLQNFIVDEGQVVAQWADFRQEYKYLGQLRWMIPDTIPFYVASATLPTPVLNNVTKHLRLRPTETEVIRRTNDRPNIEINVREMKHSAKSFQDLDFLIPSDLSEDSPPPKFLVFFDNMKESEAAIGHLRSRLPAALRHKITWFHSTMSPEFRKEKYEALRRGEIWGLCVTDAFGMVSTLICYWLHLKKLTQSLQGLDLPDIHYVVQWKPTCDMNSLWQRFGRGGRAAGSRAVAILLVEKKWLDEEEEGNSEGNKASTRKRKRGTDDGEEPPGKRRKTKSKAVSKSTRLTSSKQGIPSSTNTPVTEDPQPTPHLLESSNPTDSSSLSRDLPSAGSASMEGRANNTTINVEAQRKAYYEAESRAQVSKSGSAARSKREIESGSAMDHFINAGTRGGRRCRREVLNVYFSNDKAGESSLSWRPMRVTDILTHIDKDDFKQCDSSLPTGCLRCEPKSVLSCCDLCNATPSAMNDITNVRPTRSGASHIKPSEPTNTMRDLRIALVAWREQAAIEKLGKMVVRQFGSIVLLSNKMLDRLVVCAQARKISTPQCIRRETQWKPDLVEAYGPAIILILHAHFPLIDVSINAAISATSKGQELSTVATSKKARKPRTKGKCSACGSPDHIRAYTPYLIYLLIDIP